MKKIGIMTHHKFYNQGTMLQAYALQKKLEMMNQEAEIINYTTQCYRSSRIQKLKKFLKNPKLLIDKIILKIDRKRNHAEIEKTVEKFNEFYKNNIKLSKKEYKSPEELKEEQPNYDIYMVGSDQTWNPYIESNKETYLLDFVPDNKIKISYAPSIGGNEIPDYAKEIFKRNLKSFSKISCREEKGKKILEEILDKKVELVLDPTFLLSQDEWISVSKKTNINDDYVLCYFLGKNKENRQIAKNIAKQKNIQIVSIYNPDSGTHKDMNTKFGVGPSEFIDLVKNANYVCTDSFHGCVFSIIFNKQFTAFKKRKDKKGSDNNRLVDLLKKFGIESRMYQGNSKAQLENIDYKKVNEILMKEKAKSEKYLKECTELEGEKNDYM